jgi:hypothetical protein
MQNRRIVVVSGGREYQLRSVECALFSVLLQALGATELYHGGARGVDTVAGAIAKDIPIPVRVFHPNYGIEIPNLAPKIRNTEMLQMAVSEVGKEQVVLVVFPGDHGTSHAFVSAIGFGIPCIDFSPLSLYLKKRKV